MAAEEEEEEEKITYVHWSYLKQEVAAGLLLGLKNSSPSQVESVGIGFSLFLYFIFWI